MSQPRAFTVVFGVLACVLAGCPSYPEAPRLPPWQGDTSVYDTGYADTSDADIASSPCQWTGIYEGSLSIAEASDLERLSGCRIITGDLTIRHTTLTALALDALEEIGGGLLVEGNPWLAELSARSLRTAGWIEVSDDPALLWVGLDALGTVTYSLAVLDNPELVTVGLSSLRDAQSVELAGNETLASLELPSLRTVQVLNLGGCEPGLPDGTWLPCAGDGNPANAMLATLSLPQLSDAGAIVVTDQPAFHAIEVAEAATVGHLVMRRLSSQTLELAGLTRLAGEMELRDAWTTAVQAPALAEVGGLSLVHLPDLVSVELPALSSAGDVLLRDNGSLVALPLPALSSAVSLSITEHARLGSWQLGSLSALSGDLAVVDNPRLPQCLVEALLEQLGTGFGGLSTATGNDEAATCP